MMVPECIADDVPPEPAPARPSDPGAGGGDAKITDAPLASDTCPAYPSLSTADGYHRCESCHAYFILLFGVLIGKDMHSK